MLSLLFIFFLIATPICAIIPFGKEISAFASNAKVLSYHHADSKFVVVSAASIIAKVSRDRSIKRLNKNFNLGSGYPSDKKTVRSVKKILSSKKLNQSFIRTCWRSVQERKSETLSRDLRPSHRSAYGARQGSVPSG